jgi:hypothetical protein
VVRAHVQRPDMRLARMGADRHRCIAHGTWERQRGQPSDDAWRLTDGVWSGPVES